MKNPKRNIRANYGREQGIHLILEMEDRDRE